MWWYIIFFILLALLAIRALNKSVKTTRRFDASGKAVSKEEWSVGDFLLALFLLDLLLRDSQDSTYQQNCNDNNSFFEPCSIYDRDCDGIPDILESDTSSSFDDSYSSSFDSFSDSSV